MLCLIVPEPPFSKIKSTPRPWAILLASAAQLGVVIVYDMVGPNFSVTYFNFSSEDDVTMVIAPATFARSSPVMETPPVPTTAGQNLEITLLASDTHLEIGQSDQALVEYFHTEHSKL